MQYQLRQIYDPAFIPHMNCFHPCNYHTANYYLVLYYTRYTMIVQDTRNSTTTTTITMMVLVLVATTSISISIV